jgi:hypothetical protein
VKEATAGRQQCRVTSKQDSACGTSVVETLQRAVEPSLIARCHGATVPTLGTRQAANSRSGTSAQRLRCQLLLQQCTVLPTGLHEALIHATLASWQQATLHHNGACPLPHRLVNTALKQLH